MLSAGFGAYRMVLADREARAFSFAGLVARMPLSMTGLGIVLLISITTDSFGRAGLVAAVMTITTALTAPWWGRLTDQVGQSRVLVITAAIFSISLCLLIMTVELGLPLTTTVLASVGVGLGFPTAGNCVRARWAHRFGRGPRLDTAYAVEAVLDEVIFIVGPVLATFLATSLNPALGLVAALVLGLVGALALASQRDTQPPTEPRRTTETRPNQPLRMSLLVPIVVACMGLGAMFGGMEVVIVAFAKHAGILPLAGFLAMAWAVGSLVAGLITGTIEWQATPGTRFRTGAVVLACSVLPLPFVSNPWLVSGLLILSGLAIAPTLIASVAVTESSVHPSRLTEALSWTSTGMAGGVALGAAGLGQIIDHWGAQAGFWGVVGAGGCLILAALAVRTATGRVIESVATG